MTELDDKTDETDGSIVPRKQDFSQPRQVSLSFLPRIATVFYYDGSQTAIDAIFEHFPLCTDDAMAEVDEYEPGELTFSFLDQSTCGVIARPGDYLIDTYDGRVHVLDRETFEHCARYGIIQEEPLKYIPFTDDDDIHAILDSHLKAKENPS